MRVIDSSPPFRVCVIMSLIIDGEHRGGQVRKIAIAVIVSVGIVLSSCGQSEQPVEMEMPGMVSVSPPESLEQVPEESSRVTVRLEGENVDGVNVSFLDMNGNMLSGGVTSRGVAVLPIDTRYLSTGVHRLVLEGREISDASVVSRDVVTSDDDTGRTAVAIAGILTAEEAISLLGVGEDGGINKNATHSVRLELVQMYGIHNDQFLKIAEGDGVEKGNVKVTDLKYSVDGTTATFTTTDASTLSMIKGGNSARLNKESESNSAPMFVTGEELVSKPVESASQGDSISFEVTRNHPVLSVTAKV